MVCDWDGACNRVATKTVTFLIDLKAPDVPFAAGVRAHAALCDGHYDTVKGTCTLLDLPSPKQPPAPASFKVSDELLRTAVDAELSIPSIFLPKRRSR